jgi:hypothetical protein
MFLLPDDPGVPGDDGMRTDDLSADPDVHLAVVEFQDSISPGVAVGHRIPVAPVRHVRPHARSSGALPAAAGRMGSPLWISGSPDPAA